MIEIHIDPNIFTLGPFLFSWHGLLSAVGLLLGVLIAVREARLRRLGIPEDDVYGAAFWGTVGGIVGARLFHVVDQIDYYLANPAQIIALNEGGIAIYGAIIGGPLAGIAYSAVRRLPALNILDLAAMGLIFGQAVGRVGDVINGEHHATASSLPWAVVYTHPRTLAEPGLAVHPAVAYELLWDLLIFGGLVALRNRSARPGVIFTVYLFGYSLGRFFLSFLRLDALVLAGLTQAQIVAVGSMIVAALALVVLLRRPFDPLERSEVPVSQ
ncbi:MAG: prolipoprotein diacylglyceryl transferase [Chloroflexi bacterium]|nr:prolipoprotein diacylglyceryl transferase [Chloroflexota bacterium]